ncbi:MAG: large-conductance mechanosensitive channel protein MscL [Planctomycetota bacterium]
MGLLKEFREFALRGSVVDMTVGIIIGGAFGGLVKSLVDHVMMPPLGVLVGGLDFSDYKLVLRQAVVENGQVVRPEAVLQYGTFITVVINFLIVAVAVFLLIKGINVARRRLDATSTPAAPPGPTPEQLLTDIRDLLRARSQ